MKQKVAFLIFSLISCLGYAQQDPQYSQYMFNPLILNPAYAGSREVISTVLLYRNQWVNVDGAPKTMTASINSPLKNKKLGLGIQAVSDKIGPSALNQYMGSFAYRVKLGRGKLSFGLRAGIYDYRYDWSKIDYKDKADVYNSNTQTRFTKPNFDFGMYYFNTSFYAGLSASHLNWSKQEKIEKLTDFSPRSKLHLIANAGKAFELNKMITFRPSLVVRYTEHAPVNADLNLSFLLDEKLWIGLGLRSNKEVVLNLEYNVSKLLRIGYSYDISNELTQLGNKGTHEFFVGFDIDFFKSKTISPRIFKYN